MPDAQRRTPTAMVTGASSGIGEATAVALAQRGYRVVLVARRRDRLQALADRLGASVGFVETCDLTDAHTVEPCMGQIVATHGPIDVLVHAAGYGLFHEFLQQSMADLRHLMEVHYFAAAAVVRTLLPAMLAQGSGHVIMVGSMSTKCGPWGHAGYAAAKCALTSLTQTLHADYGQRGVNFSVIHPGLIATDFFQHPSYAKLAPQVMRHAIPPQRIAQGVIRLLDRPRVELVIPRHYVLVDWLKLLWPRLVFNRISRYAAPQPAAATSTAASDGPALARGDTPAASDVPS